MMARSEWQDRCANGEVVGNRCFRGAKFQNPTLDLKLSTVSGLFVGVGWTQAKKTLKLVKLLNNFFVYAIGLGYQRG